MLAFCPDCGERRPSADALKLRRLATAFTGALLDLDGRFWVTLRALLMQPGRLTADAIAGRRRPWLGIFQLLLFANVAYFLLQPFTGLNTLATSYESHLSDQLYSPLASELLARRLAATGADAEALADRMAVRLDTVSRALVVLLAPLFAVLLALFTLPRRLPFGGQLLLAMELLAFELLFLFLFYAAGLVLLFDAVASCMSGPGESGELVLTVGVVLPVIGWLAVALRRVVAFDWFAAIWRAALLGALMIFPIICYRGLVFVVALAVS
jgi:hypothetical protein